MFEFLLHLLLRRLLRRLVEFLLRVFNRVWIYCAVCFYSRRFQIFRGIRRPPSLHCLHCLNGMLYCVCNTIYNIQCNCNAPIIAWNTCPCPIHIGDGFQSRPSILRTQTRDAADSPLFSTQAWICDNLRTGIFVIRSRSALDWIGLDWIGLDNIDILACLYLFFMNINIKN